jgi:hypothetical protein
LDATRHICQFIKRHEEEPSAEYLGRRDKYGEVEDICISHTSWRTLLS